MKKMYIALAACACILLAGCGNVADSEETATVTTTVTTTTTAPEMVLPTPVATTAETTTTTTTAPEEAEPKETTTTTKNQTTTKATKKSTTAVTTTTASQSLAEPATQQTYVYYSEEPAETTPAPVETQPVTTTAPVTTTTKTTTTTTAAPKSNYSEFDKALAAWSIGNISASQRKFITDELNKRTAEYAKSYPYKLKQDNNLVPYRKNGTGEPLVSLTWDEMWDNLADDASFADGIMFNGAPYYYQGYMSYDQIIEDTRNSYNEGVEWLFRDAFDDGRLECTCGSNHEMQMGYNWCFYEDVDVSESYTSQSGGKEVHEWVLVFCMKAYA